MSEKTSEKLEEGFAAIDRYINIKINDENSKLTKENTKLKREVEKLKNKVKLVTKYKIDLVRANELAKNKCGLFCCEREEEAW